MHSWVKLNWHPLAAEERDTFVERFFSLDDLRTLRRASEITTGLSKSRSIEFEAWCGGLPLRFTLETTNWQNAFLYPNKGLVRVEINEAQHPDLCEAARKSYDAAIEARLVTILLDTALEKCTTIPRFAKHWPEAIALLQSDGRWGREVNDAMRGRTTQVPVWADHLKPVLHMANHVLHSAMLLPKPGELPFDYRLSVDVSGDHADEYGAYLEAGRYAEKRIEPFSAY